MPPSPSSWARRSPARARWPLAAVIGLSVITLMAPPVSRVAATGPWYPDVTGHWAAPYIRVLWEEEVLPPSVVISIPGYRERRTGFHPDAMVEPADFGRWLAAMFPGGRFAAPEAAIDLAHAPALEPATLRRQSAVAVLIESLGLGPFARAMDGRLAATYLGQFRDGSSVAPDYRQSLALAVRLGIIDGYPDRTLRPGRSLSRAEAATVLYRSCLLLAEADPNPFSPDGDGVADSTVFWLASLRNRNAQSWDFRIMDARGHTLRDLGPPGASGAPPDTLAWDGADGHGRTLPPGTYYYRGWLTDRAGLTHCSALKPVVIEAKGLSGYAYPGYVLPGETVRLIANATGGPSRVAAHLAAFPESSPLALARAPIGSAWWGEFTVPATAAPGRCPVRFIATFGPAERTAEALFEVGRFAVRAELRPAAAGAGAEVEIHAWPNLPADSCSAWLDRGTMTQRVNLAGRARGTGHESWRGRLVLPVDISPGLYPVTVYALRGGVRAETLLWLEVTGAADGLTFVLSG